MGLELLYLTAAIALESSRAALEELLLPDVRMQVVLITPGLNGNLLQQVPLQDCHRLHAAEMRSLPTAPIIADDLYMIRHWAKGGRISSMVMIGS